jgi:hypothetical protein
MAMIATTATIRTSSQIAAFVEINSFPSQATCASSLKDGELGSRDRKILGGAVRSYRGRVTISSLLFRATAVLVLS